MAARVVKGMPSVALDKETFAERFRLRFYDPEFDKAGKEINVLIEIAWKTYREYHKSPRTRKAGPGFADPNHELAIEWLEAISASFPPAARRSSIAMSAITSPMRRAMTISTTTRISRKRSAMRRGA